MGYAMRKKLEALIDEVKALIGEVQISPTQYSLLERLKVLETHQDELQVLIGEVQVSPTENSLLERLKVLETHQDELQVLIGEVQASPTENTLLERLKVLETELVAIKGYVDGLETLLAGGLPSALSSDRLKVENLVQEHELGGTQHTADALADLNTKVSDATLLDTTAIQYKTGALHVASEHENGGGLEVDVTGLSGVLTEEQPSQLEKQVTIFAFMTTIDDGANVTGTGNIGQTVLYLDFSKFNGKITALRLVIQARVDNPGDNNGKIQLYRKDTDGGNATALGSGLTITYTGWGSDLGETLQEEVLTYNTTNFPDSAKIYYISMDAPTGDSYTLTIYGVQLFIECSE